MATPMNPESKHYEGGLSFVIKSHGRLPGLPGDFSRRPIGDERGLIDLNYLEKATGIHVKIFTYTDPGGAVCPVTENIRGICSGSREDMALYESPIQDAYKSTEHRLESVQSASIEDSPLRVHTPSIHSTLPDYILASFTDEEAEKGEGLPGGVYLCQADKLIYPLNTPGTQVALSAVIQQVVLRYAQAAGATSVDIHLIACLSTGGIGVGAVPEGTADEVNHLLRAHQYQRNLVRGLGHSLPESNWNAQTATAQGEPAKRALPAWMTPAAQGGKRKGRRRKRSRTRKGRRRPRRPTRKRR